MKEVKTYYCLFFLFSFSSFQALVSGSPRTDGHVKCGPPTLLDEWQNVTAVVGSRVILTCPLDTMNSCLVDLVEWYRRDGDPRVNSTPRRLLRDKKGIKVFAFDPLMIVLENVKSEDRGWFTCVVGNSDGRAEHSSYLDITEMPPSFYQQTSSRSLVSELEDETITSTISPTLTSKKHSGSSFEFANEQILSNKDEGMLFPTKAEPTIMPQILPNSRKVSYSASRYSHSVVPSGRAAWLDYSNYDSGRVDRVDGNALKSASPSPNIAEQPNLSQGSQKQSTVGGNLFQGEKLKDQLHTDAINEHFRYIYERIEDLAKRIEKLELNHV